MDIGQAELARALVIPERTLAQRKKEGVLRRDESGELVRPARVVERAAEVFGDGHAALDWLKSPNGSPAGFSPGAPRAESTAWPARPPPARSVIAPIAARPRCREPSPRCSPGAAVHRASSPPGLWLQRCRDTVARLANASCEIAKWTRARPTGCVLLEMLGEKASRPAPGELRRHRVIFQERQAFRIGGLIGKGVFGVVAVELEVDLGIA